MHPSDFLQPGPYPTSWHLSLMLWHLSDVLLTLLPSESPRGPHSRWGWEMSLGRNKQAESLLGRSWGNTRALPNSDSSCLLPPSPQPRGRICLHGDFNSADDLCQLNRVTGKPGEKLADPCCSTLGFLAWFRLSTHNWECHPVWIEPLSASVVDILGTKELFQHHGPIPGEDQLRPQNGCCGQHARNTNIVTNSWSYWCYLDGTGQCGVSQAKLVYTGSLGKVFPVQIQCGSLSSSWSECKSVHKKDHPVSSSEFSILVYWFKCHCNPLMLHLESDSP